MAEVRVGEAAPRIGRYRFGLPTTRMMRLQGRFLVALKTTLPRCTPRSNDVHTLDELRQFIHKTLCEKENLLADQFTMTEVRLTSGSGPCGIQFCLRGPRNVRLAAIWVADRNVVYLYDARGTRYAKLRLKNRLAMQDQARAA